MKRSIITITDSEGSVIEKKEFSKEQSNEALDYWCGIVSGYIREEYNSELKRTEKLSVVRIEFHNPSKGTEQIELATFDD